MPKPTDIRLAFVCARTQTIDYRSPMKFGGRVVRDVTLLDVEVRVESRAGLLATGYGSMPVGNVWAWPSQRVSAEQTLSAMVQLGKAYATRAGEHTGWGHPLEITTHLESSLDSFAAEVAANLGVEEPIPRLAQLVCASPLEAAIHDAYGRALGQSCFNVLGREYCNRDLAAYLTDEFSGEYLDQYTLRQPKPEMPLYHLVGALDPLTPGEVGHPLDDGLPETLGQWIEADGITHLKIKLAGDDLAWDVDRVAAVDRVTTETQHNRGVDRWHYSLDFNEKCQSVEYVLDFLGHLREQAPSAMFRVQYIEQPTHRDLAAHPENKMHTAARIRPVVIDESLVDLHSLELARELGYSGVALKACKGQTGALLMAAAAQKFGMFLCVQDLTCPGRSFLHSAALAARIPGVAAIEGNGRQYCPVGNHGWRDQFPGMFQIAGGTVKTAELSGPGLGC